MLNIMQCKILKIIGMGWCQHYLFQHETGNDTGTRMPKSSRTAQDGVKEEEGRTRVRVPPPLLCGTRPLASSVRGDKMSKHSKTGHLAFGLSKGR